MSTAPHKPGLIGLNFSFLNARDAAPGPGAARRASVQPFVAASMSAPWGPEHWTKNCSRARTVPAGGDETRGLLAGGEV